MKNNTFLLLTLCFSTLFFIPIKASEQPQRFRNRSIPTLDFPVPADSQIIPGAVGENIATQEVRQNRAPSYEVNKSLDSFSGNATPLTETPTISTTPSANAQGKVSTFGQSIKSNQGPAQQPVRKSSNQKVTTETLKKIAPQIDESAAANAASRKKIFSSSATASRIAEHSTAQMAAAGIDPESAAKIAASGVAHLQSRQSRRNLNNPCAIPKATPRVHAPIGRRLSQTATAENGNPLMTQQNFVRGNQTISITGASACVTINNNMVQPPQNKVSTPPSCCIIA